MRSPTVHVLRVLRVLLEAPESMYGRQLMTETGIQEGVLYPVLHRLENEALISGLWEEDVDPSVEERPLRRYYALTPAGQAYAREVLAPLQLTAAVA